jgi:hypothetical protein
MSNIETPDLSAIAIEIPRPTDDQVDYLKGLADKELDQVGVSDETVFCPRDIPSLVHPEEDEAALRKIEHQKHLETATPLLDAYDGQKSYRTAAEIRDELSAKKQKLANLAIEHPEIKKYIDLVDDREMVENEKMLNLRTKINDVFADMTASELLEISDSAPMSAWDFRKMSPEDLKMRDVKKKIDEIWDDSIILDPVREDALNIIKGLPPMDVVDDTVYDNCSRCGQSLRYCNCPKDRADDGKYYPEKGCASNPHEDRMNNEMVLRAHKMALKLVAEVVEGDQASYQTDPYRYAYLFVAHVLEQVCDRLDV